MGGTAGGTGGPLGLHIRNGDGKTRVLELPEPQSSVEHMSAAPSALLCEKEPWGETKASLHSEVLIKQTSERR